MNEILSKVILSGLGFANLTREAIRQTVQDLVDRSKLSEEEGRRLVKEFERRSAHAQQKLEKSVDDAVHKVLKNLDLRAMDGRIKAKRATKRKSRRGHPSSNAAKSGD